MKKLLLSAFLLLGMVFSTEAQHFSKNAIGLRLGDNDGFGGEVSYQRGISSNNRLEFDLGWRDSKYYDAVKLVGLYQWVWNIDGGFNWYAGVGGGVGSWRAQYYKYNNGVAPNYYYDESGAFGLVAGDIGIEYNFDFPLQLSLDFRPELYFNSDKWRENNFGPDIALGVRYRW